LWLGASVDVGRDVSYCIMLTVKYVKDFGHPYMRECSVTHDFGPVIKPSCITVKKEAGKVVETSGEIDVVKPQATKEFQKGVNSPGAPKKGSKKNLNFQKC